MDALCGVRCYRAAVNCERADHPEHLERREDCRIGCFNPARFRNPEYPDGGYYNYTEWLCAEHYDHVVDFIARRGRGDL